MIELDQTLIADSSEVFRAFLSRILQLHCNKVHEARDADTALQLLDANPRIELVIAEASADGLDGLALLHDVTRARSAYPSFILLCTDTQEIDVAASLAGAIAVLSKPVSWSDISRVMREQRGDVRDAAPRAYASVPGHATLLDENAEQALRFPIYDLSRRGGLVATKGPIAVGTELELVLEVAGRAIRTAATVVRIQHPAWGTLPGVGVEFRNLEAEDSAHIDEHVHRLRELGFRRPI